MPDQPQPLAAPLGRQVLGESLSEIAQEIGRDKALLLLAACPMCGARKRRLLYVPQKPVDPGHWIARAIGQDAADQLVAVFGRMVIEIGHADTIARAWRKARAVALVQAGHSRAEAATAAGLSKKTVEIAMRDIEE